MQLDALLRELGLRVDEDLPPAVMKRVSIDTLAYQQELDEAGLAYDTPRGPLRPDAAALAQTAERVIASAVRAAGLLGAASGLAGALSVPPEAIARVVHSFRLAQRLAIIYGHDPSTDRGSMHVRRALSAAWEFDLPAQARVDMKLSDLGDVVRAGLPAAHNGSAWMARTLAKTATQAVGRRFSRLLPGLGAGMGLLQGRRLARHQGERMHSAILKRWNGPATIAFEDAVEILG